jgi:hypothetical protein
MPKIPFEPVSPNVSIQNARVQVPQAGGQVTQLSSISDAMSSLVQAVQLKSNADLESRSTYVAGVVEQAALPVIDRWAQQHLADDKFDTDFVKTIRDAVDAAVIEVNKDAPNNPALQLNDRGWTMARAKLATYERQLLATTLPHAHKANHDLKAKIFAQAMDDNLARYQALGMDAYASGTSEREKLLNQALKEINGTQTLNEAAKVQVFKEHIRTAERLRIAQRLATSPTASAMDSLFAPQVDQEFQVHIPAVKVVGGLLELEDGTMVMPLTETERIDVSKFIELRYNQDRQVREAYGKLQDERNALNKNTLVSEMERKIARLINRELVSWDTFEKILSQTYANGRPVFQAEERKQWRHEYDRALDRPAASTALSNPHDYERVSNMITRLEGTVSASQQQFIRRHIEQAALTDGQKTSLTSYLNSRASHVETGTENEIDRSVKDGHDFLKELTGGSALFQLGGKSLVLRAALMGTYNEQVAQARDEYRKALMTTPAGVLVKIPNGRDIAASVVEKGWAQFETQVVTDVDEAARVVGGLLTRPPNPKQMIKASDLDKEKLAQLAEKNPTQAKFARLLTLAVASSGMTYEQYDNMLATGFPTGRMVGQLNAKAPKVGNEPGWGIKLLKKISKFLDEIVVTAPQ